MRKLDETNQKTQFPRNCGEVFLSFQGLKENQEGILKGTWRLLLRDGLSGEEGMD